MSSVALAYLVSVIFVMCSIALLIGFAIGKARGYHAGYRDGYRNCNALNAYVFRNQHMNGV